MSEQLPMGANMGVPENVYHASKGLGSSGIKTVADQSVAHFLAQREKPSTAAQRIGTMAHLAILEPERFERDYIVAECGQCHGRTKNGTQCSKNAVPGAEHCGIHGGKEEAEEWLDELPEGSQIVTEDEKERAIATANGVRAAVKRSDFDMLLDGGLREISYVARAHLIEDAPGYRISTEGEDGDGSIIVRGRLDLFYQEYRSAIDVKGMTQSSMMTPRKWRWRIVDYGMHIQAALYMDIIEACTREYPLWRWLAHEQSPPYAVRFFGPTQEDIEAGREEIGISLRRWKHYFDTGDSWMGWPTGVETVSRPGYASEDD